MEMTDSCAEAVDLEKEFIRDCLPVNAIGLSAEEFCQYIDYIADRRLEGVGLNPSTPGAQNPFPWLAEMMDIRRSRTFSRDKVTEYQKSSSSPPLTTTNVPPNRVDRAPPWTPTPYPDHDLTASVPTTHRPNRRHDHRNSSRFAAPLPTPKT